MGGGKKQNTLLWNLSLPVPHSPFVVWHVLHSCVSILYPWSGHTSIPHLTSSLCGPQCLPLPVACRTSTLVRVLVPRGLHKVLHSDHSDHWLLTQSPGRKGKKSVTEIKWLLWTLQTTKRTNVTQHIKMDQLCQKFKIDFLLFPKWLFFQINCGAKNFEIKYCVLEIW